MKVAVVGCGALGSFYGAKLFQAGQETHFLLRSDYETVRRNGVRIISPEGEISIHPGVARRPEEIGACDLVLIGLKTTANDQFPRLLPPLVGEHTAVLTLQNGLGNEEALAKLFPPEQIMGGLCFVCLNRIEPGVIQHLAHGRVVLGEYRRPPEPRTRRICSLFQQSGVPCGVADDLECAHWEKLVWNIPFNGLGVAGAAGQEALRNSKFEIRDAKSPGPCLTTDLLLNDDCWESLVRELMNEVIAAGRAKGLPIEANLGDRMIERTRSMGAYKASTLVDFERGQPLELDGLFEEPLRQAKQAGVSTPRLEALCRVLRQLDDARTTP